MTCSLEYSLRASDFNKEQGVYHQSTILKKFALNLDILDPTSQIQRLNILLVIYLSSFVTYDI